MEYKGFRNINKYPAPINKWIKVEYLITGIGAPEREGWTSVGLLRDNGIWTIRMNDSIRRSYMPLRPTHWRELKETEKGEPWNGNIK